MNDKIENVEPEVPEIICSIPAGDLILDPKYLARGSLDFQQTIRLRDSDPSKWDHITVTPHPNEDGKFIIVDGAARFAAMKLIFEGDFSELNCLCIVIEGDDWENFYELSCEINLRNVARPLDFQDRLRYGRFLRKKYPELPVEEITRRLELPSDGLDGVLPTNGRGPS